MVRDRLTDTLGPNVGRRPLLQGFGLGLVGLALAPPRAHAASTPSPDLRFSIKGDAGHTPSGIPALAPGALVWVETFSTSDGTGSKVTRYPLDADDGDGWEYAITSTKGFQSPAVIGDAVLVAAGDGTVASLSLLDGSVTWNLPYAVADTRGCPFAEVESDILFVTQSGSLVRLDAQGTEVFSVDLGLGAADGFSAPVCSEGQVYILGADSLTARDATNGDPLWTVPAPAHADTHPVLAVGVGAVCYVVKGNSSSKGKVVAVSPDSGTELWSTEPVDHTVPLSAPTYASGTVYYGDAAGNLGAIDSISGAPLWSAPAGNDFSASDIVVDDGVVYATSQASSTTSVVAVPIGGGAAVTYKTGFPGVALIGLQNGLCFYSKVHKSQRITIEGVDLGDALSTFYSQSQLLADGYDGDETTVTANTPHFQSDICLYTALEAPRANAPVRVKVSEAATVIIDGTSHDLGPSDHVWTTSDAAGELSIIVKPKSSEITCPKLKLWGAFMGPGESMVVFPDQDMLSSLSTVDGATLAGMTTFDGEPLLPDSYRDGTNDPETLASRVRGVLGGVTTGFAGGSSLIDLDSPYFAFPGEATNLAFQATSSSTERAYVPPTDDQDWVATFGDDSSLDVVFGTTSTSGGKTKGATKSTLGSSKKKGWNDFFEDVVKGTKKLTKITWKAGKKAVKTFEAGIADSYEFVVDTLEKGAGIIAGMLKSFGKDIGKIIEMLTHLLDWGRIKDLHSKIKSQIKTNLDAQAGNSAAQGLADDIRTMQTTVTAGLASLVQELDGQGTKTHTKGVGQHKAYGSSYNQAKWAQKQVKSNLTKGSFASSGALASSPSLTTTLGDIFDAVAVQLGDDVAEQAKQLFSSTSQKIGSPKQLVEASFADLLDVLVLLIDAIVDAVAITAEETVAHIPDIVGGVIDLATAHIDIPVISGLYKFVSGDAMSFLDVACLLIAIPTSILAPGSSGGALEDVGDSLALTVAGGIALGMFLFMDPLSDTYATVTGDKADPVTSKIVYTAWGVIDLALIALSFPLLSGSDDDDVFSYGMFVLQFAPLALVLASTYESGPTEDKTFTDGLVDFACLCTGVVGLLFATGQAIARAAAKGKLTTKDGEELGDRLMTFVPLLLKPMLLGPKAVAAVFILIEAACDLTALILWAVETGDSSASR